MKSEKAKQYLLKVVTPIAMMYPACRAGDRGADAEESGEGSENCVALRDFIQKLNENEND